MFELIPWTNREKSPFHYLDQLEKSFFQNAFSAGGQIKTDIVDEGDRYALHAELPGFGKEDIGIELENGYLTIRAQKAEELEDSKDNYVRRERRYGSFARSFDVSGIDIDNISAKYENGVLALSLPKLAETPLPPAKHIEIQ